MRSDRLRGFLLSVVLVGAVLAPGVPAVARAAERPAGPGASIESTALDAYVVSSGDHRITAVNPATGAVDGAVSFGLSSYPNDVVANADRSVLYVVDDTAVRFIDTATGTVTDTVTIPSGGRDLALSPDGSKLFVSSFSSSYVKVINTATRTITNHWTATYPTDVVVSPDGARLYVVESQLGRVKVFTTADGTSSTVTVGVNPTGAVLSPDGTRLFVANLTTGTISVINTATLLVTNTINTGSFPYRTVMSPDGTKLYVSLNGANAVAVIDAMTLTVTTQIAVGSSPVALGLSPDGQTLAVGNLGGGGSVSVINTATTTVSRTVSFYQPQAFAFAPPPPPLGVTTATLPTPVAGRPYSTTLAASGGSTPYTWSASGLPNGLSINSSTGVLSGTTYSTGAASATITVRDAVNTTSPKVFTIDVQPAVSISTSSFAVAVVDSPYSTTVTATGGLAPYTFSASGLPTGLTISSSTGVISGTPTGSPRTATVNLTVVDSTGGIAYRTPPGIDIRAPMVMGNNSLTFGSVGRTYGNVVYATGGVTPYTWTQTGLPAGLTLNPANGQITGTPTTAGSSDVTLTATDQRGIAVSQTLPMTIDGPLAIGTTSLPDGSIWKPYSVTLAPSGARAPYTWSATGLPTGLNLNPTTGVISGTPFNSGTSTVTITLNGYPGLQATTTLNLMIYPAPQITTASLPEATVGAAYTTTVAGTGGMTPYTWSATGLPAGLSIDPATGVISGTPTASGSSFVILKIGDPTAGGTSVGRNLVVNAPVSVTTSALPAGVSGMAYSTTLAASGGTGPLTWTQSGLPAGLTLNASTGAITGTPTSSGSSSVTLTRTDAWGNADSVTLTLTVNPAVSIATTSLPTAVVGSPYSLTLAASGGVGPYTWSVSGLPAGLSVSGGVISGTPTASGPSTVSITVADSASGGATTSLSLQVNATLSITTTALPTWAVGSAYSVTLAAAGGVGPYTWTVTGLPAGLTASGGVISGTPTASGSSSVSITLADSASGNTSTTLPVQVNPAVATTTTTLPTAVAGKAYQALLAASDGVSPYTWAVTSGSLPAGLTLAADGTLSGTPTSAGSAAVTLTVTDATGGTSAVPLTLTVNAALALTTSTLPAGSVGAPYSVTLGQSGGLGPYTWTVTGLPAGLTASASGVISGTPTGSGPSTVSVSVADAAAGTASTTLTLTVNAALAVTTTTLPAATQGRPYTTTLAGSGGVTPYSWSVSGLPAGLSASGGVISGTPTGTGPSTVSVTLTDAASGSATASWTLTVNPPVSMATSSLPTGVVGTPYALTMARSNGTGPFTWTVSGLPAGLTMSSAGVISGTPTAAGPSSVLATVTDTWGSTTSIPLSLTINAALSLTMSSLPTAVVGTPYSRTLAASGGIGPYTWTVTGLPAGLTASGGVISGTPTASGSFTVSIGVTDSVAGSASTSVTLTVNPTLAVTTTSVPVGVVGVSYSTTLAPEGGIGPYSWSVTGLPAGLSLNPTTGAITGTPTVAGSATVSATLTDAASGSATGSWTLTVNPALSSTTTAVPQAVVGSTYSTTLVASGGVGPYTWAATGPLPAGLSLTSGGVLSGTPTGPAGPVSFSATVTDAQGNQTTETWTLTLNATLAVTTTTLPTAVSGAAYTATPTITGGAAPVTWSSTALPAGLTLNPTTGAITGTPTGAAGPTSVTLTATDAQGNTSSTTLTVTVNPALAVTTPTVPKATRGTAYTTTLTGSGGIAPYTWTVTTGTLPAGLTLDASTGTVSGTPTGAGTSTVTVTATDANGNTAPQQLTLQVSPAHAPTDVTATGQTSSILVSWTASVGTGITGYTARAEPGDATCTTTSPTDTSCVLGGEADVWYSVTVVANTADGDSPDSDPPAIAVPTEPDLLPAPPANAPAELTTDKGQISTVDPGEQITFVGHGFAPYSTVKVTIYSTPTTLGTAVADQYGDFSFTVAIPASLAEGAHTVLAQGVDATGAVKAMTLAVTVESAAGLATTGADAAGTAAVGALLTLAGLALIGAVRRRRPATR